MSDPLLYLILAALSAAVLALLFWPGTGVLNHWLNSRRKTERVMGEDALKHIHASEISGPGASLHSIAGAVRITAERSAELIASLESRGLLLIESGELSLTPTGRDYALRIIRAHRLWERHLADETGYGEVEWHDQAERLEHQLSHEDIEALSARLGHPTHDPHGDPIPNAEGEVVEHDDMPLTKVSIDTPARIVHLEDEPENVYAQLIAEGLHLGMIVRVTENSTHRVRFWADGEEIVLAPIGAANVSVIPIEDAARPKADAGEPLTDLLPGQKGRVVSLSKALRGQRRRRLMDLGILPGTEITVEMRSPSGDPTAYRIRDAVIALRRDQASLIRVDRAEEDAA